MNKSNMSPGERLKVFLDTSASHMRERKDNAQDQVGARMTTTTASVENAISEWPNPPREVAQKMIAKHGRPNEVMPTKLVWYDRKPWKRIEVQRDEIPHAFPAPHTDFITHYINYQVPVEKMNELAQFDGSVIVDRTRGEVAARCDMEEANILTLNLMHEIVTGKRTVPQAREKFAEQNMAYLLNRSAPYTEKLLFDPPDNDTAFLDESIIGEQMLIQLAGKVKDKVIGRKGTH